MSYKILVNTDEATKLVNKKLPQKRISYRVSTSPFLPIGDGKTGFQGCGSVKVSKKVFIKTIKDILSYFEKSGAKIELTVPTEDFGSFYI